MRINKNIILVLLVCLLSVFTYMPLFHSGFFAFHDNTQVVRVYEMSKSLSQGIFPVRLVGDLGYGYGYPIFNFYGPLPYYLGGILVQTGLGVLLSTKIVILFGILFSAISMYFFSRRFFGDIGGIVSAILYAYFPYHAVNIYVRGALGEYYAYAFMPILFLGLFRLLENNSRKLLSTSNLITFLLITISIFLVAISHNLSIFMAFLLIIPFAVFTFISVKSKSKFLLMLCAGTVFGIALSAFYMFPAFFEMQFTNVRAQIGGSADFRDHFVCISQYWSSNWGFGGSTKGCIDGLSFALGKFNILIIFISILALGKTYYDKKIKEIEKIVILGITLLIISAFLTLSVSEFVWQGIPYMAFLQYPWRFINFIALFGSFLVGYLIYVFQKRFTKKVTLILAAVIVVLTIVVNGKFFVPQDYNNLSDSDYTSQSYIRYTVSKISDEYMPSTFSTPKDIKDLPKSEVKLLKSSGNLQILQSKNNYLKVFYRIQQDGVIHINRAYFPAWNAYIDMTKVPIVPTHDGMNISIKQGVGLIELKFQQTPIELAGNAISVLSLLSLVIFYGLIKKPAFAARLNK